MGREITSKRCGFQRSPHAPQEHHSLLSKQRPGEQRKQACTQLWGRVSVYNIQPAQEGLQAVHILLIMGKVQKIKSTSQARVRGLMASISL